MGPISGYLVYRILAILLKHLLSDSPHSESYTGFLARVVFQMFIAYNHISPESFPQVKQTSFPSTIPYVKHSMGAQ